MSAARAFIHVSAERRRAAAQDSSQHFDMQPGKPLATTVPECRPSSADDIGHLDGRPLHLLGAGRILGCGEHRKRIQGAGGGAQMALRQV